MVTRCDRLVGRKEKKHTHVTSLSLMNVSLAFFYWQYEDQENNKTPDSCSKSFSRPALTPVTIFHHLIFPTLSFHSTQSWKGAGPCTYVHNWHFTVISNSYQRRVLGCKEQWEPDKSVALCSESCPDNRSIGRSIKPIISNLLMGD